MWANLKIKNLLKVSRLSKDKRKKRQAEKRAICLALKYHLVTPVTSLLVVQGPPTPEPPSEQRGGWSCYPYCPSPGQSDPSSATGHHAPSGPRGEQGVPSRGWLGSPGAQGPPGTPGQAGERGPPGLGGRPQGPQGSRGQPAPQGPSDPSGLRGQRGEPASSGPSGYPASYGSAGARGEPGTGDHSRPGPRGEMGQPGARPGNSGKPGPSGPSGYPASYGSAGATGEPGADAHSRPGQRGEMGPRGPSWQPEVPGNTGWQEKHGLKGDRGEDKRPEEQGPQGPPVHEEQGTSESPMQGWIPGQRGDTGRPGQAGMPVLRGESNTDSRSQTVMTTRRLTASSSFPTIASMMPTSPVTTENTTASGHTTITTATTTKEMSSKTTTTDVEDMENKTDTECRDESCEKPTFTGQSNADSDSVEQGHVDESAGIAMTSEPKAAPVSKDNSGSLVLNSSLYVIVNAVFLLIVISSFS